MSAPKFTPGPWYVYQQPEYAPVVHLGLNPRFPETWSAGQFPPRHPTAIEQREANARLIGAAPELYAALRAATDMIAQDAAQRCEAEVRKYGKIPDYIAERIASFRAALAKAEGGTV